MWAPGVGSGRSGFFNAETAETAEIIRTVEDVSFGLARNSSADFSALSAVNLSFPIENVRNETPPARETV